MEPQDRAEALRNASDQYNRGSSGYYDQVVNEVASRAAQTGSIGKSDIGALLTWKRLNASARWVTHLMHTPESTVRLATAKARELALATQLGVEESARRARSALVPVPGFAGGDALASAVIYALAPNRMAVYDRRAQRGIEILGLSLTAKPGRYGRYMALVEQMCAETRDFGSELSPRELDLALFTLGGPPADAGV